jgi:hypothetical protein
MRDLVTACVDEEESDDEDDGQTNLTVGKKGFIYMCVDDFFISTVYIVCLVEVKSY